GWPIWASSAATLILGLAGGGLNGLLIGRLGLPPLIVTLGSFSLYRGLAEGLSGGVVSYSGFPSDFLFLGQGYWLGFLPPQTLILGAAVILAWIYLHRTHYGRALYAIGYSAAGARFAGLPVARRLVTVYVLSGVMASLAAIIYIAHLGQAKSDAGSGYELMAITAVVLGGTSIFGGRGTIHGSVLGLLAIVILQNGLRLAAVPSEFSGILTGLLLLSSILVDAVNNRAGRPQLPPPSRSALQEEEIKVKNSQVAILSVVIIAAALIVAGSNWLLVRSLRPTSEPPGGRKMTIAVMPKAKGDPYFVSCRKGAEEAARELGIDLIWDGPTELDAARQNEVVEGWITRQVDVIAVSVENQASISTVLRKARARGINVVTWDADAESDARDFFINQATPQGIGATLTDEAARLLAGRGEFAVITGSLSAANQNEWIKYIRARVAEKYPELKLTTIQPSEDDRDRAFAQTQTILK
ncbi:MAG: substrate-binding domain-containing protein, partial [Acidobacteriota bacterium]